VNAACKKHQVALISASAIGFQAQMFMVEGDSACYECLFPKNNMPMKGCDVRIWCTCNNTCNDASLQAHHTLLYLGLNRTPLKQKLLLWDGLNMTQRIVSFDKDINCPLCQAS
jgi:adenylyltransferase/sulfurtransferase